jgi:hypothetical protein
MPDLSNKQFIFIIGAPRSGTTWLHFALASHPEVLSTDAELTVFNMYVKPIVSNFEREGKYIEQGKWRAGLPHLWKREKLDNQVKSFITNIYSTLPSVPLHKVILDKSPEYSFCVDLIHYYLPEAKFIHIIRDGRDVASSWHKSWYKSGFGNSLFSGACIDWIEYKNAARKAREFGSDKYLEIHYEKLLDDFRSELKHVLNFCNINTLPEIIDSIALKTTGEENMVSIPDKTIKYSERIGGQPLWKTRLSKEEKYIAHKLLAEELMKEGYEISVKWGPSKINTIVEFSRSKIKGFIRRIS